MLEGPPVLDRHTFEGLEVLHTENLRRALLDEAARILETEGVEAVGLRRLARETGVSHAAPGHHFGSRRELIAELAADGFRELADAMTAAMHGAEPADWLVETGRVYIRYGVENPERYRLMLGSRLLGEECPERLLAESNRAYLCLLQAAHGGTPGSMADYRMQVEELVAWASSTGSSCSGSTARSVAGSTAPKR